MEHLRNWFCYVGLLKLNFMVTKVSFETLCSIKVTSSLTFMTMLNGLFFEKGSVLYPWMVYLHAEETLAWNGIFLWNWHFSIESVCLKIYLLWVSLFLWAIWFQKSVPKYNIIVPKSLILISIWSLSIVQLFLMCWFQGNDSLKIKHNTCKTM
jgi:hypothetical protein